MTNRSEAFGRLLKAGIASIVNCEGKKAAIVEDELGQLIGISGDSIQRYKSGHLPPEDRTVEILATAAVQRGYLGREWLLRFLHAARYPFADKLLDQLCPIGPARPRPPRVYENLPAPTYSQFVMRKQPFDEVIDGLQQRSAAVLIVGLGGNGKTSLAREVATRCLQDGSNAPLFDAVVWVSDKDRPGTTNLSVVLDEIARTLDYPGFTQFAHDEKLYEVGQLLKRQKVLLVVDNFETISDGALLSWLLRLPEPSKAIITSREYEREYRRGSWPVELRGMREEEVQEFIDQRLLWLRIAQLVNDKTQLEPLLAATGGNPKAIEIALGLVKHERRPLQQVVDDLYAARGELFDDLFVRAWALLDEAARRVLLVMTFFPTSASGEALAATADVQGYAFDRAVEQLTDLALIDEQRIDLVSPSRYTLHPLVRAFARARLEELPVFEKGARQRWMGWYIRQSSKLDSHKTNINILDLFDIEEEVLYSVVDWASHNHYHIETIHLAARAGYYYYVRGMWDKKIDMNLLHAKAAHSLSDFGEELKARAYHVELLCIQSNTTEAEKHLSSIEKLAELMSLEGDIFAHYQHAKALYYMARGDLETAQRIWQETLDVDEEVSNSAKNWTRRWMGTSLYYNGQFSEAKDLFRIVLKNATSQGHQRTILHSKIAIASIALNQGEIDIAAKILSESQLTARQFQDRENIARAHYLTARLHTLRNDFPAARVALAEAIDLFERLGMRRELAEARDELARLDE
jgi:tetratricopeptide (TPR) repeat protein